jgi:hypothetical protein
MSDMDNRRARVLPPCKPLHLTAWKKRRRLKGGGRGEICAAPIQTIATRAIVDALVRVLAVRGNVRFRDRRNEKCVSELNQVLRRRNRRAPRHWASISDSPQ